MTNHHQHSPAYHHQASNASSGMGSGMAHRYMPASVPSSSSSFPLSPSPQQHQNVIQQQPIPLRRATYIHVSDLLSAYNIDHEKLEMELERVKTYNNNKNNDLQEAEERDCLNVVLFDDETNPKPRQDNAGNLAKEERSVHERRSVELTSSSPSLPAASEATLTTHSTPNSSTTNSSNNNTNSGGDGGNESIENSIPPTTSNKNTSHHHDAGIPKELEAKDKYHPPAKRLQPPRGGHNMVV